MRATLRRLGRLLGTQWAAFLTLFLLLSAGSAYALDGVDTVFSDDIVDGQVSSADVADGSLTGRDVRSVAAADLARDALGTGQVSESSLDVVPEAGQAGTGRAGRPSSCGESPLYLGCGSTTIDLVKPGRLLIIAAVNTYTSYFVQYVEGSCRLQVNGAAIDASTTVFKYDDEGEVTPLFDAVEGAGQNATLTAVSDVYPAGRQVVGVQCKLNAPGRSLDGTYGKVTASVDISVVGLSAR
ncbi:hypothetical protein [Nocardioides stalactiti]|uniref:hypothetical protein n=1 Tax=Nocardioides stalactiti TaxID=2755356 RepID=UPI001602AD14|nr:hypothetical protein [Nocardioides stalactiti]